MHQKQCIRVKNARMRKVLLSYWQLQTTQTNLKGLLINCCGLVAKMSDSLEIPWTVAHPVPLSMEFPSQEYWSGLPFASPRDLPNQGIRVALFK